MRCCWFRDLSHDKRSVHYSALFRILEILPTWSKTAEWLPLTWRTPSLAMKTRLNHWYAYACCIIPSEYGWKLCVLNCVHETCTKITWSSTSLYIYTLCVYNTGCCGCAVWGVWGNEVGHTHSHTEGGSSRGISRYFQDIICRPVCILIKLRGSHKVALESWLSSCDCCRSWHHWPSRDGIWKDGSICSSHFTSPLGDAIKTLCTDTDANQVGCPWSTSINNSVC